MRVPAESCRKSFWSSIERGAREAIESGIVTGYPMVDIRVTLLDGSFHEVDSSELAFQMAGAMAAREAAPKGIPGCWSR